MKCFERKRLFRNRQKAFWVAGVSVFFLFFCFALPALRTEEIEPLTGGIFVGDLTVPPDPFQGSEFLTLDDVTRLALARNLDMTIARLENAAERYETGIAQSVYDTRFEMRGDYVHNRQQRASVVLGDRELEGEIGVALTKKLPIGTAVTLEGATQRISTNSAFTSQPRYYESYGEVAVTHPFLKNSFGYLDRKRIKQIKLDVTKFDYATADRIEGSLSEVRRHYWDLKFTYENLISRRKALRKAQDFLKITRDKLEIGLTEKPDVYAAEANVRKRVLEVLEARNGFLSSSFGLKVLLNLPEIERIVPVQEPKFAVWHMDFERELAVSYEKRRDLKQMQLSLETQEIERKIRKNELLPQLDFEGRYTSFGLDRELASSEGEVFGFHHLQYFGGLTLTMPLELRAERGRYQQAKLGLQIFQKQIDRLKLRVAHETDDSIRQLQLAIESVRQTREIEQLQRKKLDEEEKNFNRGRSDSKTIIDFQEDVIRAETDAIRALVDYEKAVENYLRTTNQLLDRIAATAAESPKKNE